MLFNSFEYFLFFITVIPIYYLLQKQTYRVWWLLAASCYFYMYFIPLFIIILLVVVLIDYTSGIAIEKQPNRARKKLWLTLSICSNIGILFFFKYYNFFAENVEQLSGKDLFRLNVILPIGLSFHTFQSLSYVVEVYRGNHSAEKRLDVFALYVLYFPQLVAGPIERPQNVIHQLKAFKMLDYDNLIKGIQLISIGLIKKCVLADRLSLYVDGVYSDLGHASFISILFAIVFFSLQIYFDFSGYSDIAIGSAKCMGINLMMNFNYPYLSSSVREFWTRWHISLSTWFRDYVFIPLGGSRVPKLTFFRNIMIVFALSGLWHGASWNFVVWGILHGLFVYGSAIINRNFSQIHPSLKFIDITFNFILVSFLWIFFRAPDFATSYTVFEKAFEPDFTLDFIRRDFGITSLIILAGSFVYLYYLKTRFLRTDYIPVKQAGVWQLSLNFILIFSLGIFNNHSFIYFQF
jgi:alginate O-acetyltransferase complex protein AlgI